MSAASPRLGTSRHPAPAPHPAPGTPASCRGPAGGAHPGEHSQAPHGTPRLARPLGRSLRAPPGPSPEGTASTEDKGTGSNELLEPPASTRVAATLRLQQSCSCAQPQGRPCWGAPGHGAALGTRSSSGSPPAQIHPSGTQLGSCFHGAGTREPCDGSPEQLAGARKRCPDCTESSRAQTQPPRSARPALNALKSLRELSTSWPRAAPLALRACAREQGTGPGREAQAALPPRSLCQPHSPRTQSTTPHSTAQGSGSQASNSSFSYQTFTGTVPTGVLLSVPPCHVTWEPPQHFAACPAPSKRPMLPLTPSKTPAVSAQADSGTRAVLTGRESL